MLENRGFYESQILVIHLEGNINNNPKLSGTAELLCRQGYLVDIVSPKRRFPQLAPCKGSRLLLFEDRFVKLKISL